MRIIEYGHIKPKEIKCNHCGAVLEYLPNDLENWSDYYCFLRCPVCNGKMFKDNNGDELTKYKTS